MEKDLKVKVADLNEAIFETQIELEELMMTWGAEKIRSSSLSKTGKIYPFSYPKPYKQLQTMTNWIS